MTRIGMMLQSDRIKAIEAHRILIPKDNGIRIVITQQVFIEDWVGPHLRTGSKGDIDTWRIQSIIKVKQCFLQHVQWRDNNVK